MINRLAREEDAWTRCQLQRLWNWIIEKGLTDPWGP